MTIKVGDRLPETTFKVTTADGPAGLSTAEIFGGKTVVLFAVPGAFTPTCHRNHLPGYIEHSDAFKARGVDTIAVTSVNDVFVMNAWSKATGGDGKVLFLADGSADFAKSVGLSLDLNAGGLGMRSQRYAMIVKNGVVTWMAIEDSPGKADMSGAAAALAQL
jgi:peroxiredoxin